MMRLFRTDIFAYFSALLKHISYERRKMACNVYPTKKETHHIELFNDQEDHK